MGNPNNVIAGVATMYVAPLLSNGSPQPNPLYTGASVTLSAALVAGTAITALPVTALNEAVDVGDSITVSSGSNTQTFTASAAAAVAATSIAVDSLAPNFAYPVGSTVQDITTPPAPVTPVWGAAWTQVGFTEDGLKVSYDPKTTDFVVEEQETPVSVGVDSVDIEWIATLAEDTLVNANLAQGNSGVLTVTAATASNPATTQLALGTGLVPCSVGFQSTNAHGYWRVAYMPKAVVIGKVETAYRRAKAYRMYPMTIRALCAPSQVTTTDMTAPVS